MRLKTPQKRVHLMVGIWVKDYYPFSTKNSPYGWGCFLPTLMLKKQGQLWTWYNIPNKKKWFLISYFPFFLAYNKEIFLFLSEFDIVVENCHSIGNETDN